MSTWRIINELYTMRSLLLFLIILGVHRLCTKPKKTVDSILSFKLLHFTSKLFDDLRIQIPLLIVHSMQRWLSPMEVAIWYREVNSISNIQLHPTFNIRIEVIVDDLNILVQVEDRLYLLLLSFLLVLLFLFGLDFCRILGFYVKFFAPEHFWLTILVKGYFDIWIFLILFNLVRILNYCIFIE